MAAELPQPAEAYRRPGWWRTLFDPPPALRAGMGAVERGGAYGAKETIY
jgi:hypothetical protein